MSGKKEIGNIIQSLLNGVNDVTGNQDTNLTNSINVLIDSCDLSEIEELIGDCELIESSGSGGGSSGSGGSSGGSASLNIHYGDTAPSDTSMLWCKCTTPTNINMVSHFESGELISNSIPALPRGLGHSGIGSVDKKIYLFGGGGYDWGGKPINTIYKYDAETQEYTLLSTTLPSNLSNMASGTVGKYIYLFGGTTAGNYGETLTNKILKFDTETETIQTLSVTFPSAISRMGACVYGEKIYLFGGGYEDYGRQPLKDIYVFDTAVEKITKLGATLIEGGSFIGVAEAHSDIYLFGGASENYLQKKTTSIYKFNPTTNEITKMSSVLPVAIDGLATVSCNNIIYLFGGNTAITNATSWSERSNVIYTYDCKTDTLTELDVVMGYSVGYSAITKVGSSIYLFGGSYGRWDGDISTSTSLYDLSVYLKENNMSIVVNSTGETTNILTTESITLSVDVSDIYIGDSNNNAAQVEAYLYKNDTWVQI